LRAHFDCSAANLAAALGIVDVAGKKPASIDEARKKQSRSDNSLFSIKVAAVLARRNGADTLILCRSIGPAKIGRKGVDRLRRERHAAGIGKRLLALDPLVEFRFAWEDANSPHERIHWHHDAGQVF